jgi:hypothetical protein
MTHRFGSIEGYFRDGPDIDEDTQERLGATFTS